MDFDKLKQQWAALDGNLDSSLTLNAEAARAATLTRTRRTLGWHRSAARFELTASILIAVGLGAFVASQWGAARFVLPALALFGYTAWSIGFNVHHLRVLARLDFAAPITQLVDRLRRQYRARVRYAKSTLAASAILWVCWVVVVLKGGFGIDVYAGGGTSTVMLTMLACALGVLGLVVVGRLLPRRPEKQKRVRDRLAGYAISAALAQLEDLDGDAARIVPVPRPRLRRFIGALLGFVATLVLFWLAVGMAMIHLGVRNATLPPGPAQCRMTSPAVCVATRDGTQLAVRRYPGTSPLTVVLVHGLAKDSTSIAGLAAAIRDATGAEVWTPDLRGHGASQGRRGDVDYTNQYEHDLADVIAYVRAQRPNGKLILAGYEMGGGLALRYARLAPPQQADGYVLLAPTLGNGAPTERPGANLASVYQLRTMGIMMLHGLGISAYDGLPVMSVGSFAYSYRAMRNIGIVHYGQALAADSKPMLVLVGERDPFLDAANFSATFARHAGGKTVVLPGAGHDAVLDQPLANKAIIDWLNAQQEQKVSLPDGHQ
jgi:alpha-beta hydrolase superfamily lysophospholipase